MSNPASFQVARMQTLGPALIALLAVAGIVAPVAALLASIYPFEPGEAAWRFEALSLFLTTAPHLAVAIAVVATFGLFGELRGAVKGSAIAAVALAALMFVTLPFFILDYLQVRGFQSQQHIPAFNMAAMETAGITVVLIPLLLWGGRNGLIVGKKQDDQPRAKAGQGLVVAQD